MNNKSKTHFFIIAGGIAIAVFGMIYLKRQSERTKAINKEKSKNIIIK